MTEPGRPYHPTALPSVTARALAFLAIVIGGLSGGLIGYAVTDLQCGGGDVRVVITPEGQVQTTTTTEPGDGAADDDDGCTVIEGVGGLVGAALGAIGVGVVAVLVLRAMAEWRRDLDVEEPGTS